MRICVTGGRDYQDVQKVYDVLDKINDATGVDLIITGACHLGGADLHAENWAKSREIPYMGVPAQWKLHGKSAGFRRNIEMLDITEPDAVLAFPGGNGTSHCVLQAHKRNIPVREIA